MKSILPILFLAGLSAHSLRAAEDFGRTVELPPMMVNYDTLTRPWRYAERPGLQVLSRARDGIAEDFVDSYDRSRQLLTLILPAEMQVRLSTPTTFIITDPVETATMQRQLLQDARAIGSPLSRNRDSPGEAEKVPVSSATVRFFGNARLDDVDSSVVYIMIDRALRAGQEIQPTWGNIRFLMSNRTPPLPGWVRIAIEALNDLCRFESDRVTIAPIKWTAVAESRGLQTESEYPRILLPMRELLERPAPAAGDRSERAVRWRAQDILFARWALAADDPARKDAFWQYVERVSREPATEELFRQCFGIGYSDLRDRLSDYLAPSLNARTATVKIALSHPPALKFRDASGDEIARIRGEWERLEVPYVRNVAPEFTVRYQEQVANTLTASYKLGVRDPAFLETYALERCDSGDDAAAEPILERIAGRASRPRVPYELARIRFKRAAASGRIDAAAAAPVLDALREASLLSPAIYDAYQLAELVLQRMDGAARPQDFELLERGIAAFPKDAGLLARTAQLYARFGRSDEAEKLRARAAVLNK